MLSIINVNIPISITETTNLSSAIQLEKGKRVVAIEFTTPDYTNSVSTSVSIMSAAGRSLSTVASIGKNTAKTILLLLNSINAIIL